MKRQKLISLLVVSSLVNSQLLSVMGQGTAAPAPGAAAPAAPRPATAAPPTTRPASTQPSKPLTAPEIEQLVAPVALYPDSLLSQILMASTYPLEIVQADRFVKANPKVTGDSLTAELEKQNWDASVKSLVNFPTVLAMMSEKLDSTIRLGDAFLADQKSVMTAVQRLRGKAQSEGNLKTTPEQKIIVEQAPPATAEAPATTTQVIRIEPANPQVIYVPTYNPTVVYGAWSYPSYPPYYYTPPGYIAAGAIGFGLGVAAGAAWGYAWGNCNWGGNDVDIDVNRNANFNQNIDRSKYQNQINNLQSNRANGAGAGAGAGAGGRQGSWQHDPSHRQGVAYRDQNTSQRYGGASNQAAQSREAYRGRATAGQQDLNRGGASEFRGPNAASPSVQNRAGQTGTGAGAANRAGQTGAGVQNRAGASPSVQNRQATPAGGQNRTVSGAGTGMSGVGGGGRATQSASQRGTASRAASPAPRAAPRPSAPARPSGGGARTGGGGGGRRR